MKKNNLKQFINITLGTIALIVGNYFFKFPNDFIFGGVTGIAVILGKVTPLSVGTVNFFINIAFLMVGFLVLGKAFGAKTTYVTLLSSIGISLLEVFCPIQQPLTNQPVLEFIFAMILTCVGSATLFHDEASSGGTDIAAMILKKYTGANIGLMLFYSDVFITIWAFFIFDTQAALFSSLGLMVKSILIDQTIHNFNKHKYLIIISDHTDVICDFIIHELKKSATVCEAKGAFSHEDKYLIISVMKGKQEIRLRKYIKEHEPSAFILVSDSSQIFGKGFLSMSA